MTHPPSIPPAQVEAAALLEEACASVENQSNWDKPPYSGWYYKAKELLKAQATGQQTSVVGEEEIARVIHEATPGNEWTNITREVLAMTQPPSIPPAQVEAVAKHEPQSVIAVRTLIAREVWAYHECPWDFDNPPDGMGKLQKQMALDEAERIRVAVLNSAVVKAYFAAAQASPAQQTPEGWKLVPVEPLDEMLNAAQSRLCEIENVTHFIDYHFAEMFKAACLAAPLPAATVGEEGSPSRKFKNILENLWRAAEQEVDHLETKIERHAWALSTIVVNLEHGAPAEKVLEWFRKEAAPALNVQAPASPPPPLASTGEGEKG